MQTQCTNSETNGILFFSAMKYLAIKKRPPVADDVRSFQTKSILTPQPHTHALIAQNIYFKVWVGIKSGSSVAMEKDDLYRSESASRLFLLAVLFDL